MLSTPPDTDGNGNEVNQLPNNTEGDSSEILSTSTESPSSPPEAIPSEEGKKLPKENYLFNY